jgi:SAM-dependent MidA family methyltransferase
MEASLYHPTHGFYCKGPRIGAATGPFNTNAKFPAFAFALAEVVKQVRTIVGPSLRVLELGGGTGLLGRMIRQFLGFPIEYVVVDPSAGLRDRQKKEGLTTFEDLTQLASGPTLVLGNEVLDALPVHKIMGLNEEEILEFFIDLDKDGTLFEVPDQASTPELKKRLSSTKVKLGRGQVGEICLELEPLFRKLQEVVESGYLIFVDYGDTATNLYSYLRRNGTLRSYYQQQQIHDPFYAIGEQDLTADVDFTAVRLEAEAHGFWGADPIPQGKWLASVGIQHYRTEMESGASVQDEVDLLTKGSKLGTAFDVLVFKTKDLPQLIS